DGDLAPANIDVGVAKCSYDLRNSNVVGIELIEVDLDVILFRGAAPGVHRHDARHRVQATGHDPILHGAQIGQTEIRRPDDLIAVYLAGEARLLDHWDLRVRQGDGLLQAQRDLRIGKEIIHAVIEGDANERQSVKRGRADIAYARGDIESNFHGDGVVPLHLLGRETRGLRGNVDNDRCRIWIGLDIKAGKGDKSASEENEKAEQHDGAPSQAECNDALEHDSPRGRSCGIHRALAVASILLRKIAPLVATS